MDTIGIAEEISVLKQDISKLSKLLKEKRNRLIELNEQLDVWLKKTGETAVKHKGIVIYTITKDKPTRLTKQEKEENAKDFLTSIGVSDAKYVLEKLKEVQKGEPEEVSEILVDDEKTYEKKIKEVIRKKTKDRNNGGKRKY